MTTIILIGIGVVVGIVLTVLAVRWAGQQTLRDMF